MLQKNKSISVVIPNYNGRILLEKNLPKVFKALENCPFDSEVIIVDDASTDDSVEFIRKNYPQVRLEVLEKNSGFASTANFGFRISKFNLVLLLNTDVEVREDFINPLIKHFDNQDIFSVNCFEVNCDKGIAYPNFRFGMFLFKYFKDLQTTDAFDIFFPQGSAALIDKEKFLSLGGFDEVFSPFYWEDIDLGLRAQRMGLRCILEPASIVFHHTQKSISKKYNLARINKIYWRNYFLFTWKNLTKKKLFIHIIFLPLSFFIAPFLRSGYFFGFLKALAKIKIILKKRKDLNSKPFLYTTDEVLNYFKNLPISKPAILYITDTGNFLGGGEFSLLSILEKERKNFKLYLVSPQKGNFTEVVQSLNIKTFILPHKRLINPFNFFANLKNLIWFLRFIRDYNISVIHTNSTAAIALLAAIVSFFKNVSFIWHVRTTKSANILDFLLGFFSTKIIVISEAVKKRFRFLPFKNKINLIYNGIDVDKFSPIQNSEFRQNLNFSKEDILVGSVGRLVNFKGYHYLIRSLPLLLKSEPRIKILILTLNYDEKNPYLKNLKKLLKKLNLEDKVFFFSNIDVSKFLSILDIFVFPSIGESFGRALLEAMASKKVIVGFRSGATEELIKDNISGLLAKPKDYKDLARKILFLIKNKGVAEKIAENAYLEAKRFDLKFYLDKVHKLYQELVKKDIIKSECDFCKTPYAKFLEKDEEFYFVKCIRCGLIYITPKPDLDFLKSHYNIDYYRDWLTKQKNIRQNIFLKRLKKIEKYKKEGKILDIGCGVAEFLVLAKKHNWQVYGTELSESIANFVKDNFNIPVFCGSLEEANFADDFFDVITLWHVLEHTQNPIEYLKQIRRILKKDGLLVIAVPNADDYIYRIAYTIFKGKSYQEYSIKKRELHLFGFSQTTLERILLSLGFSIVRFDIDMGRVYFFEYLLDVLAWFIYKVFGKNFGIAFEVYAKKM